MENIKKWKEVVMAVFKIVSQNFSGIANENHMKFYWYVIGILS